MRETASENMGRIAFVVFLGVWCVAQGQEPSALCSIPNAPGEREFPNIFDITELSYQMDVEVNYEQELETRYFTEYYDTIDKRGRLDKVAEGKRQTFVYLYDTNEAFEIKDGKCTTQKVTDIPPFAEDMTWEWEDIEDDRVILGPSAILRQAYIKKNEVAYMGKSTNKVRGMPAEHWRQCFEGNKVTVDYYFSDSDWKLPFGTVKGLTTIPLSVRISGQSEEEGTALPQTYEFVSFQPYISLSNLQKLEVPSGYGCKRTAKDLPTPPSFKNKDIDVYGEVVYEINGLKGEDGSDYWKYINNFRLTFDVRSQHLAYRYTPWIQSNGPKEEARVADYVYEIYDMRHNVSYIYDEEGDCQITRMKNGGPKIPAPNKGIPIDILDPTIFTGSSNFQYLGKDKHRGYPVDVYEAVMPETSEGTPEGMKMKAIITRYYLSGDTYYADGTNTKNTPVRIMIEYRDITTSKVSLTISANLYGFTTFVKNKPYLFDISECFADDGVRFVITFTGNPEDIMKATRVVPEIVSETVNTLYIKSGTTPVRVQDVLVDFDNIHVFVTGYLLDRPPYQLDFDEIGSFQFTSETESYDAKTEEQCALYCLTNFDRCMGYSFCGSTCYITKSDNPLRKRNIMCTSRAVNTYLPPIPTLFELKKEITVLVDGNQIALAIEDPDNINQEPIFLSATSIKFFDDTTQRSLPRKSQGKKN